MHSSRQNRSARQARTERIVLSPFPHFPLVHPANGIHASIRKSKSLEKPVAFPLFRTKPPEFSKSRAKIPAKSPVFPDKTNTTQKSECHKKPIHIGKKFHFTSKSPSPPTCWWGIRPRTLCHDSFLLHNSSFNIRHSSFRLPSSPIIIQNLRRKLVTLREQLSLKTPIFCKENAHCSFRNPEKPQIRRENVWELFRRYQKHP
jgi:hypothetical protein